MLLTYVDGVLHHSVGEGLQDGGFIIRSIITIYIAKNITV